MTWDDLERISTYMEELSEEERERDASLSLISRVSGFLTFVNLIWFIAVAGISVAIIPVLIMCLGPVFAALFDL